MASLIVNLIQPRNHPRKRHGKAQSASGWPICLYVFWGSNGGGKTRPLTDHYSLARDPELGENRENP